MTLSVCDTLTCKFIIRILSYNIDADISKYCVYNVNRPADDKFVKILQIKTVLIVSKPPLNTIIFY